MLNRCLRSLPILFLVSLLAFASRSSFAQNTATAQLTGTVRDSQGAVIPGASVGITDDSKGFSRTTTSDAEGRYQLLLLPPGTYAVSIKATNFKPVLQQNVTLTVGEQAELPVALQIGGVSEQVVVNASSDVIETQRSSQSTTIDQVRIENLPTNGRNYINFTLTNSQIARDAAPSVGAIPTSGLNFGGVRARSNSINVDGADSGDYVSGGTRATVSQDAVQEFQIITNGFAAEYGRASGGVVNIITKSGANKTHASAFGFLRNRYIQATNPFSTVDQPAYTRVQAGFTVGGAIVPDKTFYFFSTEITRRNETGFSDIGANNFGFVPFDTTQVGLPFGTLQLTPDQVGFLTNPTTLAAEANPLFAQAVGQYAGLVGASSGMAVYGAWPTGLTGGFPGVGGFPTSCSAPPCFVPASYQTLASQRGNFPVFEEIGRASCRERV